MGQSIYYSLVLLQYDGSVSRWIICKCEQNYCFVLVVFDFINFIQRTLWAIYSVSLFGKTYNQLIILQFNTTFKRYLSNLESLALRNKQSIELIPFQI